MYAAAALAVMLLGGAPAAAGTVTWPVSTQDDGALDLALGGTYLFDTTNGSVKDPNGVTLLTAWANPASKAWNLTTFHIASTATVRFTGVNLPDIRTSGSVVIAGMIDLRGRPGTLAGGLSGSGGGSSGFAGSPGEVATGGAGGSGGAHGNGGAGGGALGSGTCLAGGGGGGGGNGGGGGGAWNSGATCQANGGNGGIGGGTRGTPTLRGGGGSASGLYAGQAGGAGTNAGGGGGGSIGSAVSDLAVASTLYPGSGGGGAAGGGGSLGGGGGGGGGALRIVSASSIAVSGSLLADGGAGGNGVAGGGGGSGGLIYLAAPAVDLADSAILTTRGAMGGAGTATGGSGGVGGMGRIRIAADDLSLGSATLVPAAGVTNGAGAAYLSSFSPRIRFTTAAPAFPAGGTSGVLSVVLEDNDGTAWVAPAGGLELILSSSSSQGSFSDAAGAQTITSVTVPAGSSTASFRYTDAAVGTPDIVVAAPGSGLSPAHQTATITPSMQESDPLVSWNGWRGVGGEPTAHGGAYRESDTIKDTASFRFSGTSITWLTREGPDMGKADVAIDGVSVGIVDLYTSSAEAAASRSFTGLAAAGHTITIQVQRRSNPASTGRRVVVDGFTFGRKTTEESSPKIAYDRWKGASDGAASGGAYRHSPSSKAQATCWFNGDAIQWITATGPAGGLAQVFVDGISKGVVDTYSPSRQWQVPESFTGLGSGPHVITVQVLGTHSAGSSGDDVIIDAFAPL